MKRFDVFLSDGHRLTTNEEGYRAVQAGFASMLGARFVALNTLRGERVAHAIEINVDHVVTVSPLDDDA
ncbi:MAG: hypothetical protein M3154_00745 [Candidatus Eremiobacteraeota bacterium]|nr:hypothetical protein [Candidatus Eremiobacteraeota bacterium]